MSVEMNPMITVICDMPRKPVTIVTGVDGMLTARWKPICFVSFGIRTVPKDRLSNGD